MLLALHRQATRSHRPSIAGTPAPHAAAPTARAVSFFGAKRPFVRKRHPATNQKLRCSGHATISSWLAMPQTGSGSERLDRDCIAEVGQTFDQALFLPIGGTSIEVIAAEVLVHRAVFENVVDGSKDRGRDGHNRLLGATTGFDAVELGLQITVFLFYRRPGALYQRGFEPSAALAHAIGSSFAGTLVVARAYAGP